MRIRVYSQHKGSNIIMPESGLSTLEQIREFVNLIAAVKRDALYRVFELTDKSPTGEQYLTSYSVLDGVVREHKDVTIPTAHW